MCEICDVVLETHHKDIDFCLNQAPFPQVMLFDTSDDVALSRCQGLRFSKGKVPMQPTTMSADRTKRATVEMKAAFDAKESPMRCPKVSHCSTGPELLLSEDFDCCHSASVQTTPSDKSGPAASVDMR